MKNSSGQFVFDAGAYWIGDPCYAIDDNKWHEVGENTGWFGCEPGKDFYKGLFYYNNSKCFAFGTVYGDGSYSDNKGNEYGVDAGLIGILPLESCDGDSMHGGHIHTFSEPFKVFCFDGVFTFGGIFIDTGDDSDDMWNTYSDDDEE